MGIPSYFSYIIKNYTNIIRKRIESVDHLLMDCNSIVYDAYHEIEQKYKTKPFDVTTIEDKIIQRTIHKIIEYIELISPSICIYITFDGVAPFAKMDQQRIRRYKTQFTNHTTTPLWNTTAITPGTEFMKKLSKTITSFFHGPTYVNKFPQTKIMVSCSDESGEGEHKLFHYLRNIDAQKDIVAVYGLDADLIMLSIFHCKQTKNIYVFREAPTFARFTPFRKEDEPRQAGGLNGNNPAASNEPLKPLLFMDIHQLTHSIFQEMGNYHLSDKFVRVTDYVFMCFLLGNDFLPHFPALNIRTHGIQIITDTYYQTIGRFPNRSFILNDKIQWNYVLLFISELAKQETNYLKKESYERDKWDKSSWPTKTDLEKDNYLLNLPVIYRTDEKYICTQEYGWENRYYRRLFGISTQEEIKDVCINYLEGLEWVFNYYTNDCIHWRWKYAYSYPPLLSDLVKYIPNNKTACFLSRQKKDPFHPNVQLAYVLPPSQHHLLTDKIRKILQIKYSELYPSDYSFQWAFCRYFWEAHPVLPDIPLSILDELHK